MLFKSIHIPNPCHEDWNSMTQNEKGAFCQSCQKQVHDLNHYTNREIKTLLKSSSRLCVKTTQDKLNELNFTEWFNHLRLKHQLKYLFLFSYLIAHNSLNAQESVCYEPQFIALDSADQLELDEIIRSVEYKMVPEEKYQPQYIWAAGTMIHWLPKQEEFELEVTSVGGSIAIETASPIYGDWGWIGTIVLKEEPLHSMRYLKTKTELSQFIGFEELVISNHSRLKLKRTEILLSVVGTQLEMYSKSRSEVSCTVSIRKQNYQDSTQALLFNIPITLPSGHHHLTLPVHHLPKGTYIIELSTQNQTTYASFNYL